MDHSQRLKDKIESVSQYIYIILLVYFTKDDRKKIEPMGLLDREIECLCHDFKEILWNVYLKYQLFVKNEKIMVF